MKLMLLGLRAHINEGLFNALRREIEATDLSPETTIRTIAWVLGAALSSEDVRGADRERLYDLAVRDATWVLRGGGREARRPRA